MLAEHFFGRFAAQEMLLIRRAFIGITGRHGDVAQPDFHHMVEEIGHAFRHGVVEQGAVDIDAETRGQRRFDRGLGLT